MLFEQSVLPILAFSLTITNSIALSLTCASYCQLKNYPKGLSRGGTSGQGMSDAKALIPGPVIFFLMGNARKCKRLFVQIQPETVKISQLGAFCVTDS